MTIAWLRVTALLAVVAAAAFAIATREMPRLADLTGGVRRAVRPTDPPAEPPPPPRPTTVISEGRVAAYPGAAVVVAAEITGTLVGVEVVENQRVDKGQSLATMRSDDLQATRDLADAERAEADAEIAFWSREIARIDNLDRRSAAAAAEVDGGRRSLAVMKARLARARAGIRAAEAQIAKTRIVAPIGGTVVTRSAHPGETLTTGTPILKIVDLDRLRVEAEVDEYDTGKIAVGAECTVTAEGFPGRRWPGWVEEIPADVVPRRVRPEDPSRPADTRVVSVKVAVPDPGPLKLGQRVYVTIQITPEPDPEPAPAAEPEPAASPAR